MINRVLVVGFACLSVVAVAQQNKSTDQPADAKKIESPRDPASAQASGMRMHKPISVQADATAKEAATGKATGKIDGKTSASDDWQASATKKSGSSGAQGEKSVAAGDVNGDGMADVSSKGSAHATEQHGVVAPRDIATGQASGKRQLQPVSTGSQGASNSNKGSK